LSTLQIVYDSRLLLQSEKREEKGVEDLRSECIVKNLDSSVTVEQLEELFSKFGKVMKVDISLEGKVKKGYVKMSDPSEAKKAQEALNGYNFKGHTLEIGETEEGGDGKYDSVRTRTVLYNR
jgi:RNA recognition motif-containing protein